MSKRYFFISLQIKNTNVWRSIILNNETIPPEKLFEIRSVLSPILCATNSILGITHSAPGFNLCRCDHENFRCRCGPVLHGLLHFATQVSYAARAAALLPEQPQKNMGLGMAHVVVFGLPFLSVQKKKHIPVPSMIW